MANQNNRQQFQRFLTMLMEMKGQTDRLTDKSNAYAHFTALLESVN